MSGIATAIVGGAVVGGIMSNKAAGTAASAATQAADTQAQAAMYSADVQREMFNKQVELQEPWRQSGINALAQMQTRTNAMPAAFTGQVNLSQDPGYAFRLSEGLKALDRQAAARGGLISGGALKAAQRYGQDLASQEYQNAYNRALTQYNAGVQRESTQYNRLAGLAGIGQTSTSQLSNAAGALGSNLGTAYTNMGAAQAQGITGAGQAQASGYLGMGNALTGGLNSYLNYTQNQNLLGSLGGGTPSYSNYFNTPTPTETFTIG